MVWLCPVCLSGKIPVTFLRTFSSVFSISVLVKQHLRQIREWLKSVVVAAWWYSHGDIYIASVRTVQSSITKLFARSQPCQIGVLSIHTKKHRTNLAFLKFHRLYKNKTYPILREIVTENCLISRFRTFVSIVSWCSDRLIAAVISLDTFTTGCLLPLVTP